MVYIAGGTVTQINVGNAAVNINTGMIAGSLLVRNGEGIYIVYSVAPTTYKWQATV
jgi:hypothetical protein